MKKIIFTLFAALLMGFIVGCSSSSSSGNEAENESSSGENEETIKFGVSAWTSTVPPTKIAVQIIEDMGYKVEETSAEIGAVYAGIASGGTDIYMDSWLPPQKQYMDQYSDDLEVIGTSFEGAEAGFVIPGYMEDIDDIEDLKGKEDMFDNEFYTVGEGDPAVESFAEAIEAYDLDIEMVHSSEAPMLATLEEAIDQKEPVLIQGWEPHSMFNKFDLKVLRDREIFGTASVNVVANKNLKEKAPDVYNFLSNWELSIEELGELMLKIENGEDPEKVASEWIKENEDRVEKMKGE
ncbi:glycine betaine ABC transporter substrate-binding protein [Virgibacillus sp. CBA3643]|uniref:glycine betaine ABC transporter substrate-binding protein n=1 Tax=Virgibacillus sp. CBA3643 TaxID=2942278 RepID=UPI0035A30C4B